MWQLAILGNTAVHFGAGAGNPGCLQAQAAEVSTWLTAIPIDRGQWLVNHCRKCLQLGTTCTKALDVPHRALSVRAYAI